MNRSLNRLDPTRTLYGLMGVNVAVYVLWHVLPASMMPFMSAHFTVSAGRLSQGWVWTLLTSAFSHYDATHLLFNGIALWVFGGLVAQVWGARTLLGLYLVGGVVASAAHAVWGLWMHTDVAALGASGAVMALAVVAAWTRPKATLMVNFLVPVPMAVAVLLYIALDLVALSDPGNGVANAAHLGGALAGGLWIVKKRRDSRPGLRR